MVYGDVFDNHLYDRNFFEHEILSSLPEIADPGALFDRLDAIRINLATGDSEAGLDLAFASELLKFLGWPFVYQQKFKFHGGVKIPDFQLFADEKEKVAFQAALLNDKPLKTIFSVWEDKAENVVLDNGKTGPDSPYFQLMGYLLSLRLTFGFLCNGHEIWYIDNSEIFSEKRYLVANFDRLVASRDTDALRIFMGVFGRAGHIAIGEEVAPVRQVARESVKRRFQSEEELKDAVYGLNGRDSLFEKCGAILFKGLPRRDETVLADLYKNCLYFTFRLIFIAYFEDKHRRILEKHPGYNSLSLASIYAKARELVDAGNTGSFDIWNSLQLLFRTLDEGNPNLDIPLFDGGLFARKLAPILERPKMMTNAEAMDLLDLLFREKNTGYKRDFSYLSVIQLGRIYESPLEFEFRIAEENLWYLSYKEKNKGKDGTIDGYFDTEDYRNIEGSKKFVIEGKPVAYRKGEVYLAGGKNSRKQSASYYTAQSLAPWSRTP
ncbi:MAG: hypothetical protein K2H64_01220 [Desulfovibrio sp.]|nr:hypothetical protein [Desulfovibrio sp.]